MKKLLLTSALSFLMASSPVLAQEIGSNDMSLSEAVAVGMITNPEYGIVANDRRAVDYELEQAEALYMPSLDFLGETGAEYTDNTAIDSETLWRNRGSLTLTQMLFDGFATQSEVKRQKARVESAAHRVDETAEFVGLDIVESFLEVLRQRDLLSIARDNVQDHVTIMGTIEEGANAGTVTQGDLEQAKARLASARAGEASTRQALREAESFFLREVGDPPGDLAFPAVPRAELPETVDVAVREALTNSPTLAIFEADMDVADAEYDASGATLYPEIDLELNATHGSELDGRVGHDTSAHALVVVNWNLYRGGADLARQKEFIYRQAVSKESRADAARGVEQDVRDTWAAMIAAGERAEQFSRQAAANEQVVSVYKDQFNLDRRTLLDVLDSQNELFVSRSSHVNSLYTELLGMYRVMALRGALLEHLNVQTPREAKLK